MISFLKTKLHSRQLQLLLQYPLQDMMNLCQVHSSDSPTVTRKNCYKFPYSRDQTQIDAFMQNVQWKFRGEEVKRPYIFRILVLSKFLLRRFCKKLYFTAFVCCTVYKSRRFGFLLRFGNLTSFFSSILLFWCLLPF